MSQYTELKARIAKLQEQAEEATQSGVGNSSRRDPPQGR